MVPWRTTRSPSTYDELGRMLNQSIDGVAETVAYDSLGRLTTTHNAIGHFDRTYDGVTARLRIAHLSEWPEDKLWYYGNDHDRRLQGLQNLEPRRPKPVEVRLHLQRGRSDRRAGADCWAQALPAFGLITMTAQQLLSARNAFDPTDASQRYDYGYDRCGKSDLAIQIMIRVRFLLADAAGTFTTYTANALNQLDRRTVQLNNGAPNGLYSQLRFGW